MGLVGDAGALKIPLMTLLLLLALALALVTPRLEAQRPAPAASSDSVEVIRVVQRYVDALMAKDTAHLRAASLPTATTVMVSAEPATAGRVTVQTVDEVVAATARGTRRFTGRVWSVEVSISGPLSGPVAIYRAPYDAWFDGAFSHCGTDYYLLARIDGVWRVSQLVYTRRTDGCEPSPLGPLRR